MTKTNNNGRPSGALSSPPPQPHLMGHAWAAKAAVLRARGKNNTLHDINQAADYLDAAAALAATAPEGDR